MDWILAHAAGGFDLGALHPAIVHFPIALFATAPLFDLAALHPRMRWGFHGATACVAFGFLAALAASNVFHHEPKLEAQDARIVLGFHEAVAEGVQIGAFLLLVIRGAFQFRAARRGREIPTTDARLILLALGLGLALATAWTGWLGGRLTYEFGVSVAR